MELQQVRYFVTLCKSMNFTRAARACEVTQPSLTRGIQRLEDELGGALFRRERNLTQLTELGRLMQPHLEQMLAMAEVAIGDASRFKNNELASLRIGLPSAVSADLATRSLAEIVRRMPMLEIKLQSALQHQVVAGLLEGDLDGAFLVDDGKLPERLNSWRLHTEDFHVVVAEAHALAQRDAISLRALRGQALISCTDCEGIAKLDQQCKTVGVAIKVPFLVDSYEQAQHIAASGLGIAILPERLPLLSLLVSRRLADARLSRAIAIAVVGGRRFSPALNAFIKLVRARDFAAESKN